MKPKKKGWTEEETKILIEKYNNNDSCESIARYFNCHNLTVRRKLEDLGIYKSRGNRYTQEEDDKIKELYTVQCLNYKEIAKILNREYSSVKERSRKLGLARKYNKIIWTEELDKKLIRLIKENKSYPNISYIFHCDVEIISKRCKFLNIESQAKKLMYTAEELDIIIDMYSDGYTDLEIGHKLRMQPDTIKHIRRKEKIKTIRGDKWNDEEKQQLLDMINNNCSLKEIKIKLLKLPISIYRTIIELFPDYKNRPLKIKQLLYSITKKNFKNCLKNKFSGAIRQCKRKNREFNITEEDVIELFEQQNGRCYYTGVQLETEPGTGNFFSIDRKDSSIGYTKENIVITTSEFNKLKNCYKIERLKDIAYNLLNNDLYAPEYEI